PSPAVCLPQTLELPSWGSTTGTTPQERPSTPYARGRCQTQRARAASRLVRALRQQRVGRPARPPGLGRALRLEPFELVRPMVDEAHGLGDRTVPGLFRDQPVHLLTHGAIAGVTLRRRAQLEHVHGFARVELHDKA